MKVQRIFGGTTEFMTLLSLQIEKEIEKIIKAEYNEKLVDIVAINMGGDENESSRVYTSFNYL